MFPVWSFLCGVAVGAGLMGLLINVWLIRIIPEAEYEKK